MIGNDIVFYAARRQRLSGIFPTNGRFVDLAKRV